MLKKLVIIISVCASIITAQKAHAGIALIRDAQTERFLRELSTPIFEAADLQGQNINIYIVNDDSLNAFVSGGQNIFLNTGLIRKYNTPDALIGVIAHETGHIAAGHLARSSEAIEKTGNAMLLSYLLGIGAVVAGSPEAGQAIMLGGSQTAERLYLKYNRGQEEAADQHAIAYLDALSYPSDGLVRLLEFFESQLVGYKGQLDEYALSHPVSQKRIELIKERTKGNHYSNKKINARFQRKMDVVLAKLEGFMDSPDFILNTYRRDNSELASYKKAIAYFRKGQIKNGLYLMRNVMANKDPQKDRVELGFLYELKGQFLFESGSVEESIIAYNKAIKMLDPRDSAQGKIAFSAAILTLSGDDEDLARLAIKRLKEAEKYESENPLLFKHLAGAYDKMGDVGRSFLSLAEFNFWRGDTKKAVKYANKAKEELPKSAKEERLRVDDLIELAKDKDDKK